ncbi:DUF6625 family protein [Flavobacterium sp.]|uniref:DUF6625 family protein n=1 Tax=Flavobacterium sp. TaxID=239 RepID=UPI003D6AFD19
MKSILLILPYFGKWPVWADAYWLSVAKNNTIDWLIITDCEITQDHPKNIKFVPSTLLGLSKHVNEVVDANVPLTPRKFCDLKPAYGDIFEEYTRGYDFWGFCDMDIVWGDIRKFITDDILNQYDIISSRKEAISGHFNLFRNSEAIRKLYKEIPNYKSLFEQPKFMWFDEHIVTDYLQEKQHNGSLEYSIFWPKILLNQERGVDSRQEYSLDKWLWDDGKIFEVKKNGALDEVLYLHFINWKKTMKSCEVNVADSPTHFYISYTAIHLKQHSNFEKWKNTFRNLYDGYYVRLWKKQNAQKIRTIKKRIGNYFKSAK